MKNVVQLGLVWLTVVAIYVFARIEGSVVASTLFWALLVLASYWTLFLVFPVLRLGVERRVRSGRHEAGRTLTVDVTLSRRSLFPVGTLQIEDQLPPHLQEGGVTKRLDAAARFARDEVLTYTVEQIKRGIHEWEYCLVTVSDVFGLFERRRRIRVLTTVEVHPFALPFDLPRDDRTGGTGEQYRRRRSFREATTTIGGVRDYASGDRMGRIDWKSSARRDRLMSKLFDPEQEKKLSIVYVPMLEMDNEDAFERSLSLLLGAIRELERKKMPFELYVATDALKLYHLPEQFPEVGHYLLTAVPIQGGRIVEGFTQRLGNQDFLLITPLETKWVRELMRETDGNYHLYTANEGGR